MSRKTNRGPVARQTAHAGVAKVSLAVLAQLLHLPEGHTISFAELASDEPGVLSILVEGPTLPECPRGQAAPPVRIVCTTYLGGPVPERKVVGRFEPI